MTDSPRITRDEVVHVARLARLSLTDAEIDEFTGQLGDILEHAADIEALDVGDIEPTSHPLPMANVTRPDVIRPSLDRDLLPAVARALAAPESERRLHARLPQGVDLELVLASAPRAGALARCKNATLFPPAYGAQLEGFPV